MQTVACARYIDTIKLAAYLLLLKKKYLPAHHCASVLVKLAAGCAGHTSCSQQAGGEL